jgi:hypothetical protein
MPLIRVAQQKPAHVRSLTGADCAKLTHKLKVGDDCSKRLARDRFVETEFHHIRVVTWRGQKSVKAAM